jgi:hypothetical protein
MGCDATTVKQSAPTAQPAPELEAQRTRPEPEHTGTGFQDSNARARPGDVAGPALVHSYRVRKLCKAGEFPTVMQALAQWKADRACYPGAYAAVIEIADSATYRETPQITLNAGEHLQLRAVGLARPVLQIADDHAGAPENIVLRGAAGSCLTLEGMTFSGGEIEVDELPGHAPRGGPFHLVLRHCKMLPDRNAHATGRTPWRARNSLWLRASRLALRIEHSMLGPLCVAAVAPGLSTLHVADSTIDGGHMAGLVIADGAHGPAMLRASFSQATLIGVVQVHELTLAEDCVFHGPLLVARRSIGALRSCYVAPGSRTPPRTLCHPVPPATTAGHLAGVARPESIAPALTA